MLGFPGMPSFPMAAGGMHGGLMMMAGGSPMMLQPLQQHPAMMRGGGGTPTPTQGRHATRAGIGDDEGSEGDYEDYEEEDGDDEEELDELHAQVDRLERAIVKHMGRHKKSNAGLRRRAASARQAVAGKHADGEGEGGGGGNGGER
jgi:hypothetical protein